jgi:hypothetical protein
MNSNTRNASTSNNNTNNSTLRDPIFDIQLSIQSESSNFVEWVPLAAEEINGLVENHLAFDIDYFAINGGIVDLLDNPIVLDLIGTSSLATVYKK